MPDNQLVSKQLPNRCCRGGASAATSSTTPARGTSRLTGPQDRQCDARGLWLAARPGSHRLLHGERPVRGRWTPPRTTPAGRSTTRSGRPALRARDQTRGPPVPAERPGRQRPHGLSRRRNNSAGSPAYHHAFGIQNAPGSARAETGYHRHQLVLQFRHARPSRRGWSGSPRERPCVAVTNRRRRHRCRQPTGVVLEQLGDDVRPRWPVLHEFDTWEQLLSQQGDVTVPVV